VRTALYRVMQGLSAYRAVNTVKLGYKNRSVSDVKGKHYCLFWEQHKEHKCSVMNVQNVWVLNLVMRKGSGRL